MSQNSEFTVFGAIGKAFGVISEEFKFFAIVMIIMVAISVLPSMYLYGGMDLSDPEAMVEMFSSGDFSFIGYSLIFYVVFGIFFIFILDRVNANLNGYSTDDYPYFDRALKKIIPLALLYIATVIMAVIGFMMLIIPGIIVMTGLYVAMPALLAENSGIFASISRSWGLTRGHRMAIFGMLLVLLIPIYLVLFALASMMLGNIMETGDLTMVMSTEYLVISSLLNAFMYVYFLSLSGVVYHQLTGSGANVDEEAFD